MYDPRAGVRAKALIEGAEHVCDRLDAVAADAEANYFDHREQSGVPGWHSPSVTAGVPSRAVERPHYASGETGAGMSGVRARGKKILMEAPRSPRAAGGARRSSSPQLLPPSGSPAFLERDEERRALLPGSAMDDGFSPAVGPL